MNGEELVDWEKVMSAAESKGMRFFSDGKLFELSDGMIGIVGVPHIRFVAPFANDGAAIFLWCDGEYIGAAIKAHGDDCVNAVYPSGCVESILLWGHKDGLDWRSADHDWSHAELAMACYAMMGGDVSGWPDWATR